MKRRITIYSVLAALLLVPSLALATHVTELEGTADCDGWTAELAVDFRHNVLTADIDFAIVLFDGDGVELERYEYVGVVTRDPGSPLSAVYNFSGVWSGNHVADMFIVVQTFHLAAVYSGGVEESELENEFELFCTVDNDKSTWSAMKALYQ